MNQDVHFITYADELFDKAKQRILGEAESSGWFNSVRGYGPEDLEDDFKEEYKDILKMKRGGGYWIWKINIYRQRLRDISDGDILVYLDAGCTINRRGGERFREYINMLNESEHSLITFRMDKNLEKVWTVKELFGYFDIGLDSEIANSGQCLGGVTMIKKTNKLMSLLDDYDKVLKHDKLLITDHYGSVGQAKFFRENRHDQSIFSILTKIYGSVVLKSIGETYFGFKRFGWKESLKYPFWETRKKN